MRSLKCLRWVFFSLICSFDNSSTTFGGDVDYLSRVAFPLFEAKKLLREMSYCDESKFPEPLDSFSELLTNEWEKQEGVSFPLSMLSSVFMVESWIDSPSEGDRWLFDLPSDLMPGKVICGICKVSPNMVLPLLRSNGSSDVILNELHFLSDN